MQVFHKAVFPLNVLVRTYSFIKSGFLLPLCIKHSRIQVRENPYFGIFYAVPENKLDLRNQYVLDLEEPSSIAKNNGLPVT